jgi:hypothetical protein
MIMARLALGRKWTWTYFLNGEAILDPSFCVSGQDSRLQISKEFDRCKSCADVKVFVTRLSGSTLLSPLQGVSTNLLLFAQTCSFFNLQVALKPC